MGKHIHLLSFLIHSPINHTMLSWAHKDDRRLEMMGDIHQWQDYARTLERGLFDGVFFADTPGVFDRYKDRMDEALKYGLCWPTHDPVVLLSALAAATERLGLAATISTGPHHPYHIVRQLSTLDYLSHGRIGWNIVTGHLRGEHRAFGLPEMEHDQRYDRAEEYMQVCYKLWDSVPPEAILADKERGEFADPAKITQVQHHGEYFDCETVSPAWPSEQGRPVLFQAGTSPRGLKFAVRHADVIFAIQPELASMKKFMTDYKAIAKEHGGGREPGIALGIQAIIGGTEEQAHGLAKELEDRIPLEAGLARLSGTLGNDFSEFDPDKPIEELATTGSQGLMKAMTRGFEGPVTIRQVATRYGMAIGKPQLIGTPEQVADQIEHVWRETGCHGFNLTPNINPGSMEDFVDQVVPILQKKDIYRTEYSGKTFRENLLEEAA
ncbi:MAG: NtaA/DmoA family FMN-dependent monooxygenase [Novosphingobium sp.]|nr:NtaA/DmoA family FMN-dependent monooxygenase [Novosphingobium sp.]